MNRKKALFLDRDGIINVDHGYISKIGDFEFTEGIFDLLKQFRDAGYLLFIVTNQSGIGRGYYTEFNYQTLTGWMLMEIEKKGVKVEHVYHCPHIPGEQCHCRKPETGMIEQALETYPIDLKESWLIGDKPSDIALAANAGIGQSIYIGKEAPPSAMLSFASITDCAHYFQENPGKI